MTTQELAPPTTDESVRDGWLTGQANVTARFGRVLARRQPRGPKQPLTPTRVSAVVTLATLSVLAVWFVLYALVFSGFQESHAQHVMYTRLRAYLASERVPFGGAIAAGMPVALIGAPSIHLRSVVVEGTSSKELEKGPGHYPTSPFPGQAGISVIFGRSTTFGSPFGSIGSLHVGQSIYLTTGQGSFTYRVDDVRHAGDPTPPPLAAGKSRLLLVTSEGSGWRDGWAPTQVMYVDASLAGKVQAAPAGRPTTAPAADAPLASDTGNLVALVLWLQAMLLVAGGLVYAQTKWGAWQLWVVGVPVVVAVLWGVTSTTLLLLPNLA